MTNQLPSDKLTKPTNWRRGALIGAAAVVVMAGLVLGAFALHFPAAPTAAATPAATVAPVPSVPMCTDYRGGVCYTPEMETSAMQQEQQLADANAAAAAAAQQAAEQQAAAQKAAQQKTTQKATTMQAPATTTTTKAPKGTPVPFVKSSDPNNANGGDYIDPAVYCASGSASTVNGVPTCD